MLLLTDLILKEIMDACSLHELVYNGKMNMAISKDIYRLKKARALANEQLQYDLAPCGYVPMKYTPIF